MRERGKKEFTDAHELTPSEACHTIAYVLHSFNESKLYEMLISVLAPFNGNGSNPNYIVNDGRSAWFPDKKTWDAPRCLLSAARGSFVLLVR